MATWEDLKPLGSQLVRFSSHINVHQKSKVLQANQINTSKCERTETCPDIFFQDDTLIVVIFLK